MPIAKTPINPNVAKAYYSRLGKTMQSEGIGQRIEKKRVKNADKLKTRQAAIKKEMISGGLCK